MKFQIIKDHESLYPIARMCDLLDVNPSSYYAWDDRPPSSQKLNRCQLDRLVAQTHQASHQIYGHRKVHADVLAQGFSACPETVRKSMASQGLASRAQRKSKLRPVSLTDSNHDNPIAPNSLDRDFHADRPNQKWLTDITEITMDNGGKLYLAGVLDLYARKIVGWATGPTMEKELVIHAFENAVKHRLRDGEGENLLHHSDRGSQYTSWDYRNLLTFHGVSSSMSRKGNCWDNAPKESFFGKIKGEWINHMVRKTEKELVESIFYYIEIFHNRIRRHETLGYMTPEEFENEYWRKRQEAQPESETKSSNS